MSDRVRRTFGDDAAVQITNEDIIRWVNDAQLQISTDNPELLEVVSTADVVSGQADYAVPADLNTLRSLMHNNFRLRSLTLSEFNEYLDGFKATPPNVTYGNGTPQVFMVYGTPPVVTLFPTPAQSLTSGLRIYYSKHPAVVTSLADSLGLPLRYHNAIVEFCLKQAYELDENPEMMAAKANQFENQLQKLRNQQEATTQEYYPKITVLPEDSAYINGGFYG